MGAVVRDEAKRLYPNCQSRRSVAALVDITINFSTPFRYDPSLGNLLLDVTNFSGDRMTQVNYNPLNLALSQSGALGNGCRFRSSATVHRGKRRYRVGGSEKWPAMGGCRQSEDGTHFGGVPLAGIKEIEEEKMLTMAEKSCTTRIPRFNRASRYGKNDD